MPQTTKHSENVRAFLASYAGVYFYRSWFRNVICWSGVFLVLGIMVSIHKVLSGDTDSIDTAISLYVMLVFGPWLAWSFLVFARKFKEIRIDDGGISICPYGLHIAAQEIKELRESENFAGAGRIELKLQSRVYIFHLFVWSWGRTLTIVFNDRLLIPVIDSA